MPEILMLWSERGRERELASRSDIKEAEDPLSSNALASTVDRSGASTRIRQVISNVLEDTPDAKLDDTGTTGGVPDAFSTFSLSTCSRV